MTEWRSKSSLLHDQIRALLESGRYSAGDRLNPAILATEFGTSTIPVRLALSRLVGEGILNEQDGRGVLLARMTELDLRDEYDAMQLHLVACCEIALTSPVAKHYNVDASEGTDDLVFRTKELFEKIALSSTQRVYIRYIQQGNALLANARRAELTLFPEAAEELATIRELWRQRQLPRLRSALIDYHQRRRSCVAYVVAALSGRAS